MNPNIAMGFQRPRFDPTEGQRNALAMDQAQMQQAATMMQMQQAQQAAQREAARMNALAGADLSTPAGISSVSNVLARSGNFGDALQVERMGQGRIKSAADQAAANQKMFIDAAPLLVNEPTFGAGLAMLPPEAQATIGNQWSPQLAEHFKTLAIGIKGQMEQQNSDRTFKASQENAAATQQIARDRNEIYKNRPVAGGVTIVNASQTAEQKERGKDLVGQYKGVRETADMAQGELASLQQLRGIDVQSGKLEDIKAGIAAYAQALGMDPATVGLKDPTNPQAFIGTAQQLVLRVMQAQKGPQTENDAKRIEQTVANLGNTPQAKDFLIDSAMAVRKRDVERADFYDSWYEQKGTYDGARKAWQIRIEKIPLLGNNPKTGLPVFYDQFRSAVIEANPGMTEAEAEAMWRKKYGR